MCRPDPVPYAADPEAAESFDVAVGHSAACRLSATVESFESYCSRSSARGVDHLAPSSEDEDPLAPVGRPDVGGAETSPLRIEPEGVQIGEYASERPSSVSCEEPRHVLDQDPPGLSLA